MIKKLSYLLVAMMLLPFASTVFAEDRIAEGKAIAYDRKKGNCLACHAMDDGELAGLVGPPLMMMQMRFPDKAELRAQVADPTIRNPATSMPPYGKHGILTEDELDKVIDYLYTL